MNYYSLHHTSPKTSFKNAVIQGLAKDRGIYFPDNITKLSEDFINNISDFTNHEIAYEVIKQFVGDEIPTKKLKEIVAKTVSFDFPLVKVDDNIASLELFHGPTMAFKDVGAKFMSQCLEYFNKDNDDEVTVLVATSGDTGGAVANGFLGAKGVKVVILYPSGKVSDIQEKQLTTLGQNITALEVDGVFDDCQEMVKTAFLDQEIKKALTSANSINVARWLPQMFFNCNLCNVACRINSLNIMASIQKRFQKGAIITGNFCYFCKFSKGQPLTNIGKKRFCIGACCRRGSSYPNIISEQNFRSNSLCQLNRFTGAAMA